MVIPGLVARRLAQIDRLTRIPACRGRVHAGATAASLLSFRGWQTTPTEPVDGQTDQQEHEAETEDQGSPPNRVAMRWHQTALDDVMAVHQQHGQGGQAHTPTKKSSIAKPVRARSSQSRWGSQAAPDQRSVQTPR